jgi:aryl-alcohol dehydrogenase-like predicted oxidoreductase
VVSIPGTTKLENLESNLGALDVSLTDEDRETLEGLGELVAGERYNEYGMQAVEE